MNGATTTKPAKVNLRQVPQECSLLGAIEDAYSRLEELRDEVQGIVDNASDGLRETQRIQTFDETASSLSDCDSPPDVHESLTDITVHYTVDMRKSKSTSRATRCAEACDLLRCAEAALEQWLDENPEPTDDDDMDEDEREELKEARENAQEVIDTIAELADNAEACEFPGMYG